MFHDFFGAAALVPRNIDGDTLVMNSDLLTTIDLEEMYIRHVDEHRARFSTL